MFLLSGLVHLMRASDKKVDKVAITSDYGELGKHSMGVNSHFWDRGSDMEKLWR